MATWKEQLQHIRNLRKEREKNDDALYNAQVKLRKANNLLQKTKKEETVLPADRDTINELRKKIGAQEKELQQLNSELQKLSGVNEKLKLIESRMVFIQKKLQTLTAQIAEQEANLLDAVNNEPQDQQLIESLKAQVDQLKKLKAQLETELQELKREHAALRNEQETENGRRREIEARKNRLQEEINSLTERLGSALEPGRRNQDEERNSTETLKEEYERAKKQLENTLEKLHAAITGIYIDPHPSRLVPNLDDGIPFLLQPVRIETRFIDQQQTNELWVRVYPDDIAVHTHEKALTDKEVMEGEKYWTAIFMAEKTGGPDLEQSKKAAWTYLANLFSSQRAAWVAQRTKPLSWGQAGINEPDDLAFPKQDITKPESWSRAPRTHIMPDRFVVMLYQGNDIVKEVVGNIIPDELMLGPDPMEEETAFKNDPDGKLQFGDAYNWTSDFMKAVEVGMGFKISITKEEAATGFSKLLVLGLNLSTGEDETKIAIETLIDNHHYSPKGFSLVKQGSPTNNTDESESAYTKNDAFNDTSYFVETGEPLFKEGDETDGRHLADALGIDYAPLQYVMNSDGHDHREAVAMNTALYAGTLGYYFDTMLQPVLNEYNQDKVREFFTKHVTGRGPVPAIRVGNQPYGILLTSDFNNWKWNDRDRRFSLPFLNGLYTTLQKYHAIWLEASKDVLYAGKPGSENDPSATLMNILGLQPGSVSFYQRLAYSTDYLNNLDDFKYGGRYFEDMKKNFNSKADVMNFLTALGYTGNVPQLLRLVYHHRHTLLDAANLVDNVPLSEKDGIRYYDAVAKKNYLHWLSEAVSTTVLESQNFGDKPAPNSLLYLNLRRALLLQLHKASVLWFHKHNIDVTDTLRPTNFHNILPQPTLTKWETMKAKVEVAKPNDKFKNMMVSEYLLGLGRDEEEAAFLNDVKKALKEIADVPTARLERCFTEHIDTCTYRLDAWQTALFDLRLKNQRANVSNGEDSRKKGIYLGAFGWVESLKPSNRKIVTDGPENLNPANGASLYEYDDNNGFVHAPSLNQAATAAVLRSGYVSHAKSSEPEAMSVNLSSERIRRAMFILQGIRNGQRLEALLGYQFERALHDAASLDDSVIKLNEYIYDFREKFPLELHYIRQQGTGLPTEAIPANNVVNGLKLSEATGDTPYGASGNVGSASATEKTIIRREKDKLSDTLDAVKDLLLSESIHQLVQGNFDRSGAVINALKDANVPPEIDVIQTPRGSQLSFTNRITIQFDPGATGNPWPAVSMTARATMEQGLNKWLAGILGDPDKLFFRVSQFDSNGNEIDTEDVTVDKLQLQPIDLIYLTGNELNTGTPQAGKENKTAASELESRIAFWFRTFKSLDLTIPIRIEFLKPGDEKTLGKFLPLLRTLKSLITDSRPLHAQDFDPPSKKSLENETNPKGYVTAELENRVQQRLFAHQNILTALNGLSIDATVKDKDGNDKQYFTLETTFQAIKDSNLDFVDITYVFADVDSQTLKDKLLLISHTGIPGSFPNTHTHISDQDKEILLQQAMIVTRRMKEIFDNTTKLIAESATLTDEEKKIEKLIAAGQSLLGDVFIIMPRFTYNNEADILLSDGKRAQLLKHALNELGMDYPAEEWLQNASHVRPKLSRWNAVLSLFECYNGDRLALKPVQLPYRANDSWLAVEFPATDPDSDPANPSAFTINHDTLSVTIHGEAAFAPASYQCGLLVDDWTELIPVKNEITGIGFHYNQPNATPPQALLLAVTPEEKGHWTWEELVGILNDTLSRAKLRAVEPDLLDKMNRSELGVLLPAILSDFSQFDLNIALDYRLNLEYVSLNNPIMTALSIAN